jgi:hypothetical protein
VVDERRISELFDKLELRSEQDRQKVLSQGIVVLQERTKKTLWIEADNITNPDGERE